MIFYNSGGMNKNREKILDLLCAICYYVRTKKGAGCRIRLRICANCLLRKKTERRMPYEICM